MPDIKVDIRTNIPTITLILYLSSNANNVLWDKWIKIIIKLFADIFSAVLLLGQETHDLSVSLRVYLVDIDDRTLAVLTVLY